MTTLIISNLVTATVFYIFGDRIRAYLAAKEAAAIADIKSKL